MVGGSWNIALFSRGGPRILFKIKRNSSRPPLGINNDRSLIFIFLLYIMNIYWIFIHVCPEGLCWVHPVGYRFWWQGLLDYFVTYLMFLLKVKLPPIEKQKPALTYHTPPYPTLPTSPNPTCPTLNPTHTLIFHNTTLTLIFNNNTNATISIPVLPLLRLDPTLRFINAINNP